MALLEQLAMAGQSLRTVPGPALWQFIDIGHKASTMHSTCIDKHPASESALSGSCTAHGALGFVF